MPLNCTLNRCVSFEPAHIWGSLASWDGPHSVEFVSPKSVLTFGDGPHSVCGMYISLNKSVSYLKKKKCVSCMLCRFVLLLCLFSHSVVPALCDPMYCSPPGSSVHGISQASILEWVAISFSRGSSWCRDWTHVSCIDRLFPYHWATKEAPYVYFTPIWMNDTCFLGAPILWTQREIP